MPAGELGRRKPSLIAPLVEQLLLILLAASIPDFWRVLTAGVWASVAFWAGAIVICRRRPNAPSCGDRLYLRVGLLLVWLLGVPLFLAVWHWKGRYA